MQQNKTSKELLNRFFSDADFRKRMMEDAKGTMEEEGFDPNSNMVERFNALSPEVIERTMDAFHNGGEAPVC